MTVSQDPGIALALRNSLGVAIYLASAPENHLDLDQPREAAWLRSDSEEQGARVPSKVSFGRPVQFTSIETGRADRWAARCRAHRNDDFLAAEDGMRELDLGAYLVWQGIRATALRAAPEQRSVGPALLEAAATHEATMLVMGAFTRSRVRSLLLGGVTSHVLRNATIPVIMAQ